MGKRVTKPVFLGSALFACLLGPVHAQEAALTFPHIAAGQGISIEVNLTNPAPHIEKGYLLLLDDLGEPMTLAVDGVPTSRADFSLPAGGVKKFKIEGTGDLKVGYGLVIAENAVSSLIGNLVFTINNLFDLSVPDCRPTTSARLFVERNSEVNSGYAVLNRNDGVITISLSVRDQKGLQIGEATVNLGPGEKASKFLDFVGPHDFIGSLEASSDSPFFVMGLRQRRTGSLAALPAAVSRGPIVGSQLLYFLDSGIDMTAGGYSEEALKSTVYELTGLTKPAKPSLVKIVNNNRSQAVTVHLYFLNDKGRDFLDFLLVIKCGETLTLDPFDFQIPGLSDLKTSNFLFGYGLPANLAASFPAAQFGSGRFLLSVLAVGAALDADDMADILYPNEMAMIPLCGVTTKNAGREEGLVRSNLHVYNARPVAFDYLSGNHVHVPTSLDGTVFPADATLKALSVFTRTLVPTTGLVEGFALADPGNSDLIDYMAGQKRSTAGTVVIPSTAVFTWGLAPFTFLPGGR
jgi:hypothetical protein